MPEISSKLTAEQLSGGDRRRYEQIVFEKLKLEGVTQDQIINLIINNGEKFSRIIYDLKKNNINDEEIINKLYKHCKELIKKEEDLGQLEVV